MVLSIAMDTFYGWALDTDIVQLFVRRQQGVPGAKRSIFFRNIVQLVAQTEKLHNASLGAKIATQCITREDGRMDDGQKSHTMTSAERVKQS